MKNYNDKVSETREWYLAAMHERTSQYFIDLETLIDQMTNAIKNPLAQEKGEGTHSIISKFHLKIEESQEIYIRDLQRIYEAMYEKLKNLAEEYGKFLDEQNSQNIRSILAEEFNKIFHKTNLESLDRL